MPISGTNQIEVYVGVTPVQFFSDLGIGLVMHSRMAKGLELGFREAVL